MYKTFCQEISKRFFLKLTLILLVAMSYRKLETIPLINVHP